MEIWNMKKLAVIRKLATRWCRRFYPNLPAEVVGYRASFLFYALHCAPDRIAYIRCIYKVRIRRACATAAYEAVNDLRTGRRIILAEVDIPGEW